MKRQLLGVLAAMALSLALPAIASAAIPENTSPPYVTGTAQVGQGLHGYAGSWANSPTGYTYQWQRCATTDPASCVNVGISINTSATSVNRTTVQGDIPYYMRLKVLAKNASGSSAYVPSAMTAHVKDSGPLPYPQGNPTLPAISGTAQEGKTLTASTGGWLYSDTPTYTYQWLRCDVNGNNCANVSGATASTYVGQAADVNLKLRVRVTASNVNGSNSQTSAATAAVLPPPPVNTVLPQIGGISQEGELLSSSTGSWTNSPTSYAYQWERCDSGGSGCANISAATSSTYVLASGDVGSTIRTAVTATNPYGSTSVFSAVTAVVLTGAPVNTQAPTITGFTASGETTYATTGEWDNDPSSYTYEWSICSLDGSSCPFTFTGSTNSYAALPEDVGSALKLTVTAANQFGSSQPVTVGPFPVLRALESLATDYRPGLRFDSQEGWRPLEIHQFFADEAALDSGHQLCVRPGSAPDDPLSTPCGLDVTDESVLDGSWDVSDGQVPFIEVFGHEDHGADYQSPTTDEACHAPTPNLGETDLRDCNDGPATVIYYHAGQDSSGLRYLDYWWFFRYNDVDYDFPSLDDHEGDWEGVTVVLDPLGTTTPVVRWVIFAAHEDTTWVAADLLEQFEALGFVVPYDQQPGPVQIGTYVAKGTHAAYPDRCVSVCDNPSVLGSIGGENHHGGEEAWGYSGDDASCDGCVVRLPADPTSWTFWPGLWGSGIAQNVFDHDMGGSPKSPGRQGRYTCTANGWICDRPRPPGLASSLHRPGTSGSVARSFSSSRYCGRFSGPEIAALACDEVLVRKSFAEHRGIQKGSFHLRVRGRRSGDAAGLAQVLGPPLPVGTKVLLDGKATRRMTLVLQVRYRQSVRVLKVVRLDRARHAVVTIRLGKNGPRAVWHRR